MELITSNLAFSFIILFFACIGGIILLKGNDRYWIPGISIWLLLFIVLLLGNVFNTREVSYQEAVREQPASDNIEKAKEDPYHVAEAKNRKRDFNTKMIHLIGFQSFMCMLWMLVGYKKTSLAFYKTGATTFLLLCIVYLGIQVVLLL